MKNYVEQAKLYKELFVGWQQLAYKYERMFTTMMNHWNELPHDTRQSLNGIFNEIEKSYQEYDKLIEESHGMGNENI